MLPTAHGPAVDHNTKEGQQGPGGAAAQSRFMGRTHIPIFRSAPVDGAPVVSRTSDAAQQQQQQQQQAAQAQPSGGQRLFSRQSTQPCYGWQGAAQTCDGSGPQPGESQWEFNVDTWQWQNKEGMPGQGVPPRAAKHDIAARRWGDGRDTLGAALAAQQEAPAAQPGQGALKRQRVVVKAVRGGTADSGPAGWASIGGLERQKEQLTKAVLLPLRHPMLFKRLGVDAVRGGSARCCCSASRLGVGQRYWANTVPSVLAAANVERI